MKRGLRSDVKKTRDLRRFIRTGCLLARKQNLIRLFTTPATATGQACRWHPRVKVVPCPSSHSVPRLLGEHPLYCTSRLRISRVEGIRSHQRCRIYSMDSCSLKCSYPYSGACPVARIRTLRTRAIRALTFLFSFGRARSRTTLAVRLYEKVLTLYRYA